MHGRGILTAASVLTVVGLDSGCSGTGRGKDGAMRYEAGHLSGPITIDANWDKPVWRNVQPIELGYYMGDKPEHLPKVQAKVAYDDRNVYVIFRVEDNYVRAVAKKTHDMVCRDSCAEFFFAPGTDVKKGYFNLETNCGGTILMHFQTIPRQDLRPVDEALVDQIEIAHSLPKIVDPEIAQPTVWTIEYRLPVDIMDQYLSEAAKPAPGVEWRVNFFKCADQSSHPHWLTWAHVDRPRPDFHVPECFGTMVFK